MPDKPLEWLGSSRKDLQLFPVNARRLAGFQLRRVQQGLDPNDWKPIAAIGPGVREIRIHVEGEHRVFYAAAFAEAVYVLHAFQKKARKAPVRDINIGRDRFRDLAKMRQERGFKTRDKSHEVEW